MTRLATEQWFVAAALALTAAAVRFVKRGEVPWSIGAAAIVLRQWA